MVGSGQEELWHEQMARDSVERIKHGEIADARLAQLFDQMGPPLAEPIYSSRSEFHVLNVSIRS